MAATTPPPRARPPCLNRIGVSDVRWTTYWPGALTWLQAGRPPSSLPPRRLLWPAAIALAALAVLTVAVLAGLTLGRDSAIELGVHAHARGSLTAVMTGLTVLGYSPVLALIVVVAGWGLLRAARRLEAVALAAIMVGEGALDDLLKLGVHRARPQLFVHAAASGWSFPSGHAFSTFCLCGTLLYLVWADISPLVRFVLVLVATLLVFGIGLSRVYLGVHFPSDVVGGWLAGVAWLGAAIAGLRRLVLRWYPAVGR